jgi:CubicO group peptidase (beta-lactamase class C family)
LLVAVGLVLWSGLASAAVGSGDRASALERLHAEIAAVLEREGVPGAGFALVDTEGLIHAGGVGWADVERRQPVDADTMFRVGSITKSVVALGVARLWERGAIDLDGPVDELVTGVEIGNPYSDRPITLAHLLEHTAAFDDMRFNETFGPIEVEQLGLHEVLAKNPRSRMARWRPGSRFAYANPGYTVAAAALEHATGASFEAVLSAEVLVPLGMTGARFRFEPGLADRLATGYFAAAPLPYTAILHRPAGSLMASSRELAGLVHMWLGRGTLPGGSRLLRDETLARIERAGTLPFAATDVDYGLGNYGDVMHPVRSRGHDGGLPGFLSTYRYFPELGVGYVLLLNATHSSRAWVEIRMLLFEYLARNRARPSPPPRPDIPREQLAEHVGHYEFASPRHQIFGFLDTLLLGADVELEDDALVLRLRAFPGPIPLLPTGHGRFRLPGQSGTSVQFSNDLDDRPVMLLQTLYFERTSRVLPRLREHGLKLAWLMLQSAAGSFVLLLVLHLVTRARSTPGYAQELRLLAPFVLGPACLVAAVVLLLGSGLQELGSLNPRTVGICVLPLAFSFLSVFGAVRAVSSLLDRRAEPTHVRLWVRLHAATVGIAAVGLSTYLAYHHLVGLRTWAW